MPSKTFEDEDSGNSLLHLLERGEEVVAQAVSEWVRSPDVARRLKKGVGQAAEAKRQVDENLQFLLSLLNVPSRADFNRLARKVEALQGSMVNINTKPDRLLAAKNASPPRVTAPSRGRTVKSTKRKR